MGVSLNAVSLGNLDSKTLVVKNGIKVTTATTANQSVFSYTVTTGKTLFIQVLALDVRFTTINNAGTFLGTVSIQFPTGTLTHPFNNSSGNIVDRVMYQFSEAIPLPSGTTFNIVCTPNVTTSITWTANLIGYER